MAAEPKNIFVIGGTGAQGLPIVRDLVASDERYSVTVLTRDTQTWRAQHLASLPRVQLLEGTFTDEAALRAGFTGAWGAFVNIDGFNSGEKTEIFWGMRCYELALECGVQVFSWGNLDFVYKKAGYDPTFRTGHYDGKGRVGEWILHENKTNGRHGARRMSANIFTTGPYLEMAFAANTIMTPTIAADGAVEWRVPLGSGAVVHVALDDCGHYVRWLFDHWQEADGMDLEVAIAHVTYRELAAAFEKVTGHPARWVDVTLQEYWDGPMGRVRDLKAGYNADPADAAAMTVQQNFTGFWNMWRASGGNAGVIRRNYELLDRIHPHRIRSAEEWIRREDEAGKKDGRGGILERIQPEKLRPVLKLSEDKRKGVL